MLRVQASNVHIYNNLAQAYEAEFSQIMGKVPDRNGMFPIDTVIDDSVRLNASKFDIKRSNSIIYIYSIVLIH
jgi:hypothetical protein